MKDSDLRAAYQAAGDRSDVGAGACPEPEALLELVTRAGPEERRLETLDHVMACARCREELEILRDVVGAAPPQRSSATRILAMAASVAVLAGVGLGAWNLRTRTAPEPIYRAGGDEVALVAPSEGAEFQGQLVWRSVEGAVQYRVEVFDASGEVVLTATTADTALTITDSTSWPSGADLRWWVQARLRDGSERASRIETLGGGGRP